MKNRKSEKDQFGYVFQEVKNSRRDAGKNKIKLTGISVLPFLDPAENPCPNPPRSEVSQLLQAWNEGDETALEKLMPLVHKELHRMARHYMARESPGHTLQTTALVNEAYVRLVDFGHSNFQNRIHFLAVCAQAMSQHHQLINRLAVGRILADWARSRRALKRGGKTRLLREDEALDESTYNLPCVTLHQGNRTEALAMLGNPLTMAFPRGTWVI
jgi:RNA polymerase sigma factor (TIGR02999 family)